MKKTKTETKKVTEEVKKDPRASETREATKRPVEWTPPSSLDAPPAPDGFRHRWIRAESLGFNDSKNIQGRLRSGYELVRSDEYPDWIWVWRQYRPVAMGWTEADQAGIYSSSGPDVFLRGRCGS